jgi:hypothetical protein
VCLLLRCFQSSLSHSSCAPHHAVAYHLAPHRPPTTTLTESIGLENTEDSRRAYRELLVTTPGLGQYISGAIMFEETLTQVRTFGFCLEGVGFGRGIG